MFFHHKNLFYLFLLFLFFNCENKKDQSKNTTQTPQTQEIKPKYAKLFTILEQKEHTILRIFEYTQDQKLKNQKDFILSKNKNQKNKKKPNPDNIIQIPLQNLAVCSHTHLACVDLLGESQKIKGVTEGSFLAEAFWQKQLLDKKVLEIGKNGSLNPEIIHQINPEIILTSNFDLSITDKNVQQLMQAGIVFVPNLEWQENHPLARAEWIKVFGYLLDKKEKSQEIFENIEKNYLQYKKIAEKANNPATQKPSVMMGLPYQGVWYVAGGQSFMAQFLRDANMGYHWDKNEKTASLSLNFEQIYEPLSKADFWINVGMATSKQSVLEADLRIPKLPNIKNIKIFNPKQSPKGGSLYLTKGVVEPDKVLKDFIKMFYPELGKGYEFTYYTELL